MKIALLLLLALLSACASHDSTIKVAPQINGDVKPDFLQRVESATLRAALDKPGKTLAIKVGRHHLNVPCDNVASGGFARVAFNVEAKHAYQLTLVPCGVIVKEAHV